MNITFEQAINNYLKYVKVKNKRSSYRSIENRVINHILPYVKTKSIKKFNSFDYLEWQQQIDDSNLSFSYKSTLHTCFVTFLNYCMKFYDLKENVASKVGNFTNNNSKEHVGQVWNYQEFTQFISCVDDIEYNVFFKFLFFTGCRLGEALGITFLNVDFDNNTISIESTATRFFENNERIFQTPKTKKSMRKICIDNELKNELLNLRNYYITKFENYNDNFFIFGGEKTFAPTTITRKKDYYCSVANVKRIKIHEFRHSHACLLFQNNVPIDEISYRLGHSKISMTSDIYLKYLPKNEKRVLQTLNALRLPS